MKTFITTLALVLSTSVAFAQDYSNVSSGMLLGIYAQGSGFGLKVTSTIPGYSAVGRLYPGDVITRVATNGGAIYSTRSLYEMERAKSAIGPNREAAVEFHRPGQGTMYAWVEFTPLYGPTAAATAARTGQKQYGAQFKLESEKPGARALFSKKPGNNPPKSNPPKFNPPKIDIPRGRPIQIFPKGGSDSAARLFD